LSTLWSLVVEVVDTHHQVVYPQVEAVLVVF
jgi:hypothetical protein